MARNKNNRKNKNASTAPTTHNKVPVKKNNLLSGLFKKAGIELDDSLESNLSDEQVIELQDLIETLQVSIDKNDQIQTEIEAKEKIVTNNLADSLKQKEKLESDNKAIVLLRKEIESKANNLITRDAESLKLDRELAEREANAQAGFTIERKASLDKFKASVIDAQNQLDKLEEDKLSLEMSTVTNQRKQKIEFEKQLQQQLSDEIEELKIERSNLNKFQVEIKVEKQEINKLKLQYNLQQENQNLVAENLRFELTNKFQLNEQQLNQEIESLKVSRKRDLEKFKLLQQKINGYNELEHEATLREFSHPSDVLAHLDQVEQELREARSKLKGRTENDLEDELEHYKDLAEEKSDALDELQQDYQEVRNKVNKNKISVREKMSYRLKMMF